MPQPPPEQPAAFYAGRVTLDGLPEALPALLEAEAVWPAGHAKPWMDAAAVRRFIDLGVKASPAAPLLCEFETGFFWCGHPIHGHRDLPEKTIDGLKRYDLSGLSWVEDVDANDGEPERAHCDWGRRDAPDAQVRETRRNGLPSARPA